MNEEFKYSLVTTVFNDKEAIISLIKEMEKQTLKPVEFIIADGGSKDGTPEQIREYAKASMLNIKVLQNGRMNIAQGFNYAIKNANCKYIGIVACGNHYPINFFECLMEDFKLMPNIESAYAGVTGYGNTDFARLYASKILRGKYTEKFPTNHGNLTCKKLFEDENYFYEKFEYAGEDQEFFLRIKNCGHKVYADERVEIDWEVPGSVKEYIKQQKGYIVSDMEMYDNRVFLEVYLGRLRYTFLLICMVLLLLIPATRMAGLALFIYFLYKNAAKMRQGGVEYVKLYNVSQIFPIYVIIKRRKFLKRKNKIEKILHSYT